jgi:glutathione peroxidase
MSVYEYKVKNIKGEEVSLSDFKGKVLLIVNTASKCGLTPQYDGLEKLYNTYQDKGLVILGFPCNQFLAQEPGNDEEISSFCRVNYGVTFPLFTKVDVVGEHADPLFNYLTESAPFKGFETEKEKGQKIYEAVKQHYPDNLEGNGIKWNFTKFLVDRHGNVKARFEPTVTPEELEESIKSVL